MPISLLRQRTSGFRLRPHGNHHTGLRSIGWVWLICLAIIQLSLNPAVNAQRSARPQEIEKADADKSNPTPQVTYPPGTIYTVAGDGQYGYGGDGSKATVAQLRQPTGVVTYGGNFYIADYGNDIIREVDTTSGNITTVAGTPVAAGYKGDGGPATSALLNNPQDVTFDSKGNMYIADSANDVIRKVDLSGTITTIAGTGTKPGYNGDGGAATSALLNYPVGLCFDRTYSNLYISDKKNNVIRVMNMATGIINTFAGTGTAFYSGDGGPASLADLNQPNQIFMDAAGDLYIADSNNYAVRKVDAATGNISTIAGTGAYSYGYLGDGTLATLVTLRNPFGIVVDSAGNVFFSDAGICVIFEIQAANREIKVVSGETFQANFSGDGGPARSATLNAPAGLALDPSGNGYLADSGNERVREIADMAIMTGVTTAPTFSPAPGKYISSVSVTLADATPNAVIYFTTDGTTPTTSSPQYGGAILITETTTIKAFAKAPGDSASSVVSETYTIRVAAPTFSPAAGTYPSQATVTISDTTSGATIYFTTDGSTPTTSSRKYTGPITVSATETIMAIATETGDTNSAVASAAYTITPVIAELQFIPVTPCRIVDTRNPTGALGGPELAKSAIRTFDIPQSACGIPSTAAAYSLNVTVVPIASLGYLTIWPTGETQPDVSTLNSDGRVKANATITPAGTNGGVNVYVSDATQFILDIDGYFVPAGTSAAGLEFFPVMPCRIVDTRNPDGPLGGPSLASATSRAFPIQSPSSGCGIPSKARAYSLNVTAVPHEALGFLSVWPTGETQPVVSTLNASTGAVTANAAIVQAGVSGDVSVYVSDASDVILDVNGYFAPPATGGLSLYTVAPCRVIDTRNGAGAFDGTLTVPVETSVCPQPAAAQAYVLNATVVPPGALGYLSLWAAGTKEPVVSTLNADDGAVTSNMAIVPTTNGSVDAFAAGSTQLILDISSYFAP